MNSREPIDESDLLRMVRSGDRTALRIVYDRYSRYLAAVCSRYVADDNDVRDVLHDSFLKIFSGFGSFEHRGEGSMRGWMARITVNESLKFLHRENRLSFVEIADIESIEDPPPEPGLPAAEIHRLIRELPDGYRAVFNLFAIEGKSHREIAGLLGIKESTSASQFHRAKSLLAEKIKKMTSR